MGVPLGSMAGGQAEVDATVVSAVRAAVPGLRVAERAAELTAKKARRELEAAVNLPAKFLDAEPYRSMVLKELDAILQASASRPVPRGGPEPEAAAEGTEEAGPEPEAPAPSSPPASPPPKPSRGAESVATEGENAPKRRKTKSTKAAAKKKPVTALAPGAGALAKTKAVIKAAGIRVGPTLYSKHKGDDAGLQAALAELLDKEGLSTRSSADEVAKVRERLELARDMDGIDASNIVEGSGRRARRGVAFAVQPRYAAPASSSGDDDDSVDDDDDDDDDSGDSSSGGGDDASEGFAPPARGEGDASDSDG